MPVEFGGIVGEERVDFGFTAQLPGRGPDPGKLILVWLPMWTMLGSGCMAETELGGMAAAPAYSISMYNL